MKKAGSMKKMVLVLRGLVKKGVWILTPVFLVFLLFCSLPYPDFFTHPTLMTVPQAHAALSPPVGKTVPEPAEGVPHGTASHGEASSHAHEHGEEVRITPQTAAHSSLPIWIILTPLLGALMLLLLRDRQGQGAVVTMICGLTLVISWLMYPPVMCGQRMGAVVRQGIYYSLPFLPSSGLNLTFKVDPAALVLVIFTCLVWLLVSIFSQGYLIIENNRLRYNVANLCCLGVTLGAFLAGDLFTLYLFFESILLFLYLMVIHREDEQALKAAKVYLYFGVFTGLMLLFGIFLFSYFAGSIEIQSAVYAFEQVHPGLKYLVAALFLVGFGGKAGVFLEHIWMPSSYGSAPCLTAALSSGIMIEVGAYGIFRTVNMIFAPSAAATAAGGSCLVNPAAWATSSHLGYVLIFVGIVTMFLGAVNALFSTHALRLLAYSSISQMGYIVMGIGCAAYMGRDGAMGLAGALYHIINHALFKAGLFLSIGVVYFHTRELDIRKLGGLWKDMPIAALTFLISALAIAGFPLFNGFASKTMLHHAIVEAYQYSVHLSLTHTPDVWLRIAGIIFIITAGGTFAYNMKLFTMVFLGPEKSDTSRYSGTKTQRHKASGPYLPTHSLPSPLAGSPCGRGEQRASVAGRVRGVPLPPFALLYMNASLILFSTCIVLLGLFPNWLLENFIGPMLPYFGFDATSHAYHLIYNVHAAASAANSVHSHLPFWYDSVHGVILGSSNVIHNLSGESTAIFIGGAIFLLYMGTDLFYKTLSPAWSLAPYYQKAFEGFRFLCRVTYEQVVGLAEKIIYVLMVQMWIPGIKLDLIISQPALSDEKGMFRAISRADEQYANVVDQTARTKGMFGHISKVDQVYDNAFDKAKGIAARGIFDRISYADEMLSSGFDKVAERRGIFNNAMKADGQLAGAYDRVIFSRFFWGMLAKRGEFKSGLWRYFNLVEDKYDRLIERVLFGLIGSEDLSKIQLGSKDFASSWFLRLCRRASEIHTGDISVYISWIAVTLTIIIATLVGFLYIKSFFALIVALTTMITFFAVLVGVISFFLKR
jgi:formate hydrogenlyase subunit 3/multisubunit Na+/H+ antiporter MnhD subunit